MAGSQQQEKQISESIGNSQFLAPSSNKLTFAGPIGAKKEVKKGSGTNSREINTQPVNSGSLRSVMGIGRYHDA